VNATSGSDLTHLDAVAPFADGALTYFRKGWGDVFPVGTDHDRFAKAPVPKGVTGYDAPPVGFERIKLATQQKAGRRNLGIRMPRQIIGLDVDEYDGHGGAATLAAMEGELGPLPATWRNSARGSGTSGHRFYRVPVGHLVLPGAEEIIAKKYGPNIEVLHRGRRYAVAWPSRNPSHGHAAYQWYAPDGTVATEPPAVVAVPMLPDAWAALLSCPQDSPAAVRSSGNLRAPRGEVATDDDDLFDDVRMPIRRTVAEARTFEQVRAVVKMTEGEVNKVLGGAGIWLARMAASGLLTLGQARDLIEHAARRNGVHSDEWNRRNKRGWTLDSRVSDALSQGLAREPYQIIDDQPETDMYGQLKARLAR
jgi:hypothetical protein